MKMIGFRTVPRACLVALFILISIPAAADPEWGPLGVLVDIEPGDQASQAVARVVADAVIVRLQLRGFGVDASDHPVLVSGVATVARNDVRVELTLAPNEPFDNESDQALPRRVAGVLPIDINLDRAVGQLVDDLLDSASPLLAAISDHQAQIARERDPVVPEPPEETIRPVPGPVPPPIEIPADRTIRPVHLGILAGFSPAVPALEAARYVGPSLGASMLIVWFPTGREGFAVGVTGRYVSAQVTGVAASGPLTIVPFGLSIGSGVPGARVSPYARVSAGMAFFKSEHPVLGSVQSLLPWAAADLGMRLSFGFARLELGAGAEAYLDGDTLLLAFVPAVAFGVVF
ncbi:MAG: hypothetical protein EA382_19145 [Spirochaetaceae bacterium]|nr:MAG: hypothetical protein EA382_19145 [Spirochaetaceae bacterium]